jgi:hypothetical protein
MIWFRCNSCGHKHQRPEAQSGTMIFCSCGQGLRIPWSSTIAEPEEGERIPSPPPPPDPLPAYPAPRPGSIPVPRAIPVEDDSPRRPSIPLPATPPLSFPTRRSRQYRKVDPDYCFNHGERGVADVCAECRLPFCNDCLVAFVPGNSRDQAPATASTPSLCGPCKNFRIASSSRPPSMSVLAILSLILGLISGPVACCLGFLSLGLTLTNGSIAGALAVTVLGLLLPSGTMVLAGFAIREVETRPNVSGRGLAMTAFTAGLLGSLLVLTIGLVVLVKFWRS